MFGNYLQLDTLIFFLTLEIKGDNEGGVHALLRKVARGLGLRTYEVLRLG